MAKKQTGKQTAYGTELSYPKMRSNHKIKSRYMAATLAFILGIIGVNQFYLGNIIKGILKILLTVICLVVGVFLDMPLILIPVVLSILTCLRYLAQTDAKFAAKNHVRVI